jgi:hypothetical protein
MEDDDLTTLLRENGYDVFVMDPKESASEFISRVIREGGGEAHL